MYQSIAITARAQLGEHLFRLSTACEGPDANQGEPTAGSDAAIDLTRKLVLTSVVLLVGPDSMVQLWFVTTAGLVFLVLYLAISPYRDQAAGRIQLAALVQLEFTYVSS